MTLLPIIYSSLVLVFSLLGIIMIISYISFRTRSKENPVISEERIKQQSILIAKNAVPSQVYSYQLQVSKPFINTSSVKSDTKREQKPLIVTPSIFNTPETTAQYERGRKITSAKTQYDNAINYRNKVKNLSRTIPTRQTRIEIMNNNERFQSEPRAERYIQPNQFHDISQSNILNFYQDSQDAELVSITALPYAR